MQSAIWAAVAGAFLLGVEDQRTLKVLGDRKSVEEGGFWIYNDLPRALDRARETGKPVLVVIRCIPCEACAQLDAQVVQRDPAVQKLLDKFVCVRIINANGLDLSLFQYDYDQSFAAFFLNADKTIYGRYGTRSHETESAQDVSVEGFARSLEAALKLHEQYPANKQALAAKRGPEPKVKSPEQFPSLKEKYGSKLAESGNVAASCIHCHQVGEALRRLYRDEGEPIPDRVMFPYPMPNILGLTMDPKQAASILEVAADSPAERSGFRSGDQIVSLAGQPLVSTADIQWVLHHGPASGELKAEVRREGQTLVLPLALENGWRRRGDLSWRASSWDLRRMAFGGMRLRSVTTEERSQLGLAKDAPALWIKHVGQYGDHAAAKRAGFLKDDVLVELEGQPVPASETELLAALIASKKPGQRLPAVVLRGGKRVELEMPVQ
ncbi:MAG TPA: Trx7/PDZ domain-containing (seleno)protein [Pirellulales bacterium]|nr:Trx7/PDZ domain-containing (seleno)protein [Pirellulales bacterium]